MLLSEQQLRTRCLSSLTKVFADEELRDEPFQKGSALGNESYSYQVAYCANMLTKGIRVHVVSELNEYIVLSAVGLVPSELPVHHDHDEHYLRITPGLYPDPLYRLGKGGMDATIVGFPGQWRSLWVNVQLNANIRPGNYSIKLHFESDDGDALGSEIFDLEVIPALLPDQKLIHTEWFHTDCLATYYQTDVFSEKYWDLVEAYVQTAVRHGINMILTPLFTPPLDTAVGGERLTVQLVDVSKEGAVYTFGFQKLQRWIDLCDKQGIQYFEFSHLFTQWGAKHAPKIIAEEQGVSQQIFGWETEAAGEEYRNFLNQFLPVLKQFIEAHQLKERVYFHVSDEPSLEHLEQYRAVSDMLMQHLNEFPIIDALSRYPFYEQGVVKIPIPANNHIEPFIEHNVKPLWTYYCVSQKRDVSNRFFSMPSARNRIIATQLYKFDIEGFLHWGFNFWNAQYSVAPIDPFQNTDASYAFPSGDAFLVYPGAAGPIESIRMKVFYEALQDLRAMQLLESYIGKEAVMELLEEELAEPITFKAYPRDQAWLLAKREQVNQRIKEQVGGI